MTEAIEKQVERFAPGFRDCIAARSVMGPAEMERHNPNLIGGDIGGGAAYLSQMFLRPTASLYRTPWTESFCVLHPRHPRRESMACADTLPLKPHSNALLKKSVTND